MLKSAVVFFRKLRVSYVVLIAVAIAYQIKEFDLILFTLAFIFVGSFFDILTDNAYMAKRIKNPKKEVR